MCLEQFLNHKEQRNGTNIRSKFNFTSEIWNVLRRILAANSPATVKPCPPLIANTPGHKYKASFHKANRRSNLSTTPVNS